MSTTQKAEVVGTLGSDLDEYVAQLIRCEMLSENGIRMICDKVKIPLPLSFFGVHSSLEAWASDRGSSSCTRRSGVLHQPQLASSRPFRGVSALG